MTTKRKLLQRLMFPSYLPQKGGGVERRAPHPKHPHWDADYAVAFSALLRLGADTYVAKNVFP